MIVYVFDSRFIEIHVTDLYKLFLKIFFVTRYVYMINKSIVIPIQRFFIYIEIIRRIIADRYALLDIFHTIRMHVFNKMIVEIPEIQLYHLYGKNDQTFRPVRSDPAWRNAHFTLSTPLNSGRQPTEGARVHKFTYSIRRE